MVREERKKSVKGIFFFLQNSKLKAKPSDTISATNTGMRGKHPQSCMCKHAHTQKCTCREYGMPNTLNVVQGQLSMM